jgi:hypothetical protein
MRLYEIVGLQETTVSGSIATVAMPLGPVQRRIPPDSLFQGKYTIDSNLTPNTPDWMKKFKGKK